MQVFRSASIVSSSSSPLVAAKTLRQWSAPEVILVVTALSDELTIMPQVINQARYSHSKIVLAHVVSPKNANLKCRQSFGRTTSRIQEARAILDRMARHLRWLGFTCEPLVLSGRPELEIASLARSCCVDRVILAFEDDPDITEAHIPTLAELLLPVLDVPICVIGRSTSSSKSLLTRNIALALSLDSGCEVQLGFASRLAQELRAKLTLFHVINPDLNGTARQTSEEISGKLPLPAWREAQLLCPTDLVVRAGDPAEQILSHCASSDQDLIILCSPSSTTAGGTWIGSNAQRIIAGSQCPVFVVGKRMSLVDVVPRSPMSPEKISAYGEPPTQPLQKEASM